MVVNCVIDFDQNPHGIYFAGQVLTGKITLQSDQIKQVKGIALKINGFAHTSWTESSTHNHGNERKSESTRYYGREDYIATVTYLLGSEENQSVNIEPGIHTYNFACHIPTICPTSFEGHYGHIRYTVKVVLIRPWKFDQTYTKGFTVLKVMDLNYDSPILRVPASSEIYKTFCCGPCSSEPLKLNVSIPQSGYVPGQHIPVSVLITNDSNMEVQEVKVALAMLVCYYSQAPCTHTKTERTTVTKVKGVGVLRHCKKNFNYDLQVPATPPTCFNLCRLIQIAYQVEVEAKVKSFHANQVVCIPVTIGNVPLMGVVQQQPTIGLDNQRAQLDAVMLKSSGSNIDDNANNIKSVEVNVVDGADIDAIQTLPMDDAGSSSPWTTDANIAPPCYEEAVHMKRGQINADEAHDYGQKDFAPRYPVFSIPSPTAPTPDEIDGGFVNGSCDPKKSTWL